MLLGKHTNAIVLFLLALCVLFPFSGLDLYATDRSYKFLDAALVMGIYLLTVKRLTLQPKELLTLLLAIVLIWLPMLSSPLTHDAQMQMVPLQLLLLAWAFWSVLLQEREAKRDIQWTGYLILAVLLSWSLIELVPLLLDGSIDHQETYVVDAGLGHRNLLVQVLLILLPVLLIYGGKDKWSLRLQRGLLLLSTIVILLLLNRTGWLGLTLIAAFMFYHRRSKGRINLTWKWLLPVLIPLGLLLLFVDELYTLWHHVEMTFTLSDGTTRDRLLLVGRTFTMFWNQPILGVGYGMWPIEAMGFDQSGMLTETATTFYQRPHNDYLWLLAEGGLLLGLPYILLHAGALIRSWQNYRVERDEVRLGVFLLWCMIILASATNYPIEQPLFILLQAFGLSQVFPLVSPDKQELHSKRYSFMARILATGLWITVVLTAFDHGGSRVLFEKAKKASIDNDPGFALAYLDAVRESAELDDQLRPFPYWEATWNSDLSTEERIQTLDEGLLLVPHHPHLHEAQGRYYMQLGDLQQARLSFEEAVRYTPKYQAAWLGMAEIHHQNGAWRKAFEAILQADASVVSERYRDLGTALARDSLSSLARDCDDRKMQLTLIAIRNTPEWSLDILRKSVLNAVEFEHQAYVDACYYMLKHCDEYQDCELAETMINRYLPNGKDDLNLEANEE